VQWFAPTGHTLRGIFLEYWNKYGGLYQFGYPITEEFFEPVGADNRLLRVQYFERNRFEFHPEYANTQYEVLLGSLGRDFRTQDPPTGRAAGSLFFGETGHNILGTFRAYWETHGGAFVHGYPMTEAYMERNAIDGKMYLVQYFERSRFELHPEYAGTRYEILLGLLGRQLSEKKGFPHGWYPLFGRATDFSWLSGFIQAPRGCIAPIECSCYAFRYDASQQEQKRSVELYDALRIIRDFDVSHGRPTVVFGRLAGPEDPEPTCSPGYVANRAQKNPAKLVP